MRTSIIRIGNSRGIRIPKPILEECGFGETVQLRVEKGQLIISADQVPRMGWEEAFRAAGTSDKDEISLQDLPGNRFDEEEWTW